MTQELKTIDDEIMRRLEKAITAEELWKAVEYLIKKSYNHGLDDFESKYSVSINLLPNPRAIEFLAKYTFDNIKGMQESLIDGLRKSIIMGLMNQETSSQIERRVSEVFNVSETRAKAIARTESHRAYNAGSLHGAKQSGLKLKKEWYNPDPQSDVCKALAREAPIPIDETFEYKGQKFIQPPGHVNCRSRLLYVQEDA